jgi:hypothetical protein
MNANKPSRIKKAEKNGFVEIRTMDHGYRVTLCT